MKKKRRIISSILLFIIAIILGFTYFYNNHLVTHQPKLNIEDNQTILDSQITKLNNLHLQNNDLVGWINIEKTNINYPIMYTKDNFYLHKDFYKHDFKAGSLFIDKNNNLNPRDINLIIHGHSMKDGSMFHDLLLYKEYPFYLEHKTFTIYTLTEVQTYQVIATIVSKVYASSDNVFKYYQSYNIQNEEEYNNYILNIKKLALYNTNVTANYPEQLLTLSTCEYSTTDGRLAVIAKRIK